LKKLLSIVTLGCLAAGAFAQTAAAGFITWAEDPTDFRYNIHLTNTGTTKISTLWYSWIPGQNYMTVPPTQVTGPDGWVINITHTAADGYAIRWNGAPNGKFLEAGATLDGFRFHSTETPWELAGPTPFHNNPPTGTTFVYENGPFSGGSSRFVINPVPEPTSMLAMALGGVALLRRRRKQKVSR
jgi:hypothetical protein